MTTESPIDSIELRTDLARVILTSIPDRPGAAAGIFTRLGEAGFNIEAIIQTGAAMGRSDVALAVKESEAPKLVEFFRARQPEFGAKGILLEGNLAMIGVFSHRLSSTPGTAGRIFEVLGKMGINIEVINAGPVSLTLMLPRDRGRPAYEAIKDAFGLS